ncbi:MAG: histidine--tRNA ligase [Candidatus Cloacimonetes bacterium]|nr:histidine--tRNA ligase [Candidatus Cloacimonadota bacterium]
MAEGYKIPRGTFDILPSESYKWNYVMATFRRIAESYGYHQITTPIFEQSDLFERSVGDATDIIQKEMYRFQDRKGRSLALRPEGTAPVVRSFVENNLLYEKKGNRLYYMGPMFRYDRPQKGRYRQFYQYGVENFGSDHPYIDAEVIALGYSFLKELGLTDFSLEINSIGTAKSSEVHNAALSAYFEPHLEELCADCRTRLNKNPKRLLDCKVPSCRAIAGNAPSMLAYLDEESAAHFARVQEYLTLMEIPFTINPTIVRGLDYYSKTAFEYINNNLGSQNALAGGGRYDTLVEQLGGKATTGIGFAGGFERLILSMEQENLSFGEVPHPRIFLVSLGDEAEKTAIKLLTDLHNAGISAAFDVDKTTLNAQMKAAGKSDTDFTGIMGDDEIKSGKISLKNMRSGEQILIPINELITFLKKN